MVASVKHLAAYGQPEGGREYNTTDMSTQRLCNLYLPPFKAAVDAGAGTAMCSFNAINGVPGCANPETETDILKSQWGFDGFVESGLHRGGRAAGVPAGEPQLLGLRARRGGGRSGRGGHGASTPARTWRWSAPTPSTSAPSCWPRAPDHSSPRINDAVRRILRVKFRAGLFEHPYVDLSKAEAAQLLPDAVAAERKDAASKSMVLLKNDNSDAATRPDQEHVAVIGPLGDDQHDMLGPWWGTGRDQDAVVPVHRDQGAGPERRRS